MRCDRYWREGVLLVEQGRPDPHRDTCLDCRREHEARAELVRAFALVGADEPGDPAWQAGVWRRLAREVPQARPRRWWVWAWPPAAVTAALALALAIRLPGAPGLVPLAANITAVESADPELMRGTAPTRVGQSLRGEAPLDHEIWFYRREDLVFRCAYAGASEAPGWLRIGRDAPARSCTRDARGLVADLRLEQVSPYTVLIVRQPDTAPTGERDPDTAAAITHGWLVKDARFQPQ